jgi:hypothetical protein
VRFPLLVNPRAKHCFSITTHTPPFLSSIAHFSLFPLHPHPPTPAQITSKHITSTNNYGPVRCSLHSFAWGLIQTPRGGITNTVAMRSLRKSVRNARSHVLISTILTPTYTYRRRYVSAAGMGRCVCFVAHRRCPWSQARTASCTKRAMSARTRS